MEAEQTIFSSNLKISEIKQLIAHWKTEFEDADQEHKDSNDFKLIMAIIANIEENLHGTKASATIKDLEIRKQARLLADVALFGAITGESDDFDDEEMDFEEFEFSEEDEE